MVPSQVLGNGDMVGGRSMISAIFQRNHDVIHLAGNLGGGGQGGQTVGKAPQLEEGEKQFSLLRTSSLTRLPCLFFL